MSVSLDEIERLTSAEIASLGLDVDDAGTQVWNTDTNTLIVWNGSAFETIDTDATTDDLNYVHEQAIASDTWTINHNLDKFAIPIVVDSAGSTVEGSIEWIDSNTIEICFIGAFTGKAYIN